MKKNSELKIAVVADWLVTYAGSEKVLSEILQIFPEADLFSVVDFLSEDDRKKIGDKKATTTFIQKLPLARKKYRTYLPFMPFAIEQLDLHEYDVIISSSHAVAKGIIVGPDQLHISYIHSPIRYAWDMQDSYLKESGLSHGLKSFLARLMLKKIRDWDYRTANGVDYFISNSDFIGRRIWRVYRRTSTTIYPPVDVNYYRLDESVEKKDFYLTASRLVAYKKTALIVKAFTKMPDKRLVVIGKGPEYDKIKQLAAGHDNIKILGYQPDDVLRKYMREAKAFVYAALEDFGIVPVEAQSAGTPVIALGKGGTAETVLSGTNHTDTGVVFYEQTTAAIIEAIQKFENSHNIATATEIAKNASKFSQEEFEKKLKDFILSKIRESGVTESIQ